MIRKGMNFRHAPRLSFRLCNGDDPDPERDSAYVVVVKRADCLDASGEFSQELREKAPMHGPHRWSRTNMIYSDSWRKQTRGRYINVRVNGEWEIHWKPVYWTAPVYWVEDGWVFRGTNYRYEDPTTTTNS